MNGLQKFEHRLEQLISGAFARAFRSAVQPVEIAAALQRECDNNAQILSRDRRLVPNDFTVELSDTDLQRLQAYDTALERELVEQVEDHAEGQGYAFPGPVSIALEADDDLTTGRFRIRSRAQASVTDNDHRTRTRSTNVALEVNGTRHPVRPPGLVVGRGTEADLRVNDPGVSRRHAEFVVSGDTVEVADLGSTNGVLVDGHKVARTALRDGAVVRIGRTEMTVKIGHDDGSEPDV